MQIQNVATSLMLTQFLISSLTQTFSFASIFCHLWNILADTLFALISQFEKKIVHSFQANIILYGVYSGGNMGMLFLVNNGSQMLTDTIEKIWPNNPFWEYFINSITTALGKA